MSEAGVNPPPRKMETGYIFAKKNMFIFLEKWSVPAPPVLFVIRVVLLRIKSFVQSFFSPTEPTYVLAWIYFLLGHSRITRGFLKKIASWECYGVIHKCTLPNIHQLYLVKISSKEWERTSNCEHFRVTSSIEHLLII